MRFTDKVYLTCTHHSEEEGSGRWAGECPAGSEGARAGTSATLSVDSSTQVRADVATLCQSKTNVSLALVSDFNAHLAMSFLYFKVIQEKTKARKTGA